MPYNQGHKKSNDIKACIPFLYFREGYKVKDICRILGLGKTLIYECIQNYMRHQFAHRLHYQSCGHPCIVKHAHVNFICQLLSTHHTHYLDELQTELFHTFNIRLSLPTISRTLHWTSISRKWLLRQAIGVFIPQFESRHWITFTIHLLEHNDILWAAFWNHVAELVTDLNQLMFTDEASKDDQTHSHTHGYSNVGTQCAERSVTIHSSCISVLPLLTLDGIVAYDLIEGAVSSAHFVCFLWEQVVCPFLSAWWLCFLLTVC